MRVLITGGLGCVGSQIAREYLDAGHDAIIWDQGGAKRNTFAFAQLRGYGGVGNHRLSFVNSPIQEGDIENDDLENGIKCDRRPVEHALFYLRQVDAVIHAAASTGIPHSAEHPDDDWASNVDATKVLLDALRERPVPTVILSSVKPYQVPSFRRDRDREMWNGLTESTPLAPDEPYAASKAAQSMLAMAWARSYDLPVVTLRCSNLYGPAPCHGPRHGWLTWFCISAAIGRPLEVQGGGEQARDMLYGTDVYRACEAALANARTLQGRVFNIGGGRENIISVRQAAERLAGIDVSARASVQIVEGPGRKHEDQLVFVDHSAFTKATGWRPQVPVGEGLLRTYAWAREEADELRKIYEGV